MYTPITSQILLILWEVSNESLESKAKRKKKHRKALVINFAVFWKTYQKSKKFHPTKATVSNDTPISILKQYI